MAEVVDYPAAHSMDSYWFAVDERGAVAMFETGEMGALPNNVAMGFCDGENFNADQFLAQVFARAAKRGTLSHQKLLELALDEGTAVGLRVLAFCSPTVDLHATFDQVEVVEAEVSMPEKWPSTAVNIVVGTLNSSPTEGEVLCLEESDLFEIFSDNYSLLSMIVYTADDPEPDLYTSVCSPEEPLLASEFPQSAQALSKGQIATVFSSKELSLREFFSVLYSWGGTYNPNTNSWEEPELIGKKSAGLAVVLLICVVLSVLVLWSMS